MRWVPRFEKKMYEMKGRIPDINRTPWRVASAGAGREFAESVSRMKDGGRRSGSVGDDTHWEDKTPVTTTASFGGIGPAA